MQKLPLFSFHLVWHSIKFLVCIIFSIPENHYSLTSKPLDYDPPFYNIYCSCIHSKLMIWSKNSTIICKRVPLTHPTTTSNLNLLKPLVTISISIWLMPSSPFLCNCSNKIEQSSYGCDLTHSEEGSSMINSVLRYFAIHVLLEQL